MNPTTIEWSLLFLYAILIVVVRFQRHIIRELEKRTGILENKTDWILPGAMPGESPSRYDHGIEPLSLIGKAKADELQMEPKKVQFRFEDDDESEEDDPLRGLPKRYG